MENLYVNGNIVELDSVITRKLQVADVGKVSEIKSNFSYTIKIPRTSKNIQLFEMLGVIGNRSETPYIRLSANYVVDGITLVSDGILFVKSIVNQNYYEANLIDGVKSLSELVDGKFISDLDFTDLNHVLTEAIFEDSLTNTEGFIYGFGQFGKDTGNLIVSGLSAEAQAFEAYVQGFALPLSVLSNDEGGGAIDVRNTEAINNIAGSFYEVASVAQAIEFNVSSYLAFSITSDSTEIELLLKQFRSGVLYDTRTIVVLNGDDLDELLIDDEYIENFTDVQVDDFFILSAELVLGSYVFNIAEDNFSNVRVTSSSFFKVENVAPSLFLSTILNKIMTEANISYSGDFLTDVDFLKEVVQPANGFSIAALINFSELMGDVLQIDVIKDISSRYGLVIIPTSDRAFQFVRIEEILSGALGSEDWSSKFSSVENESFESEYGKKNYLKFTYANEEDLKTVDGTLVVDNYYSNNENDLYESVFEIAKDLYSLGGNRVYEFEIWEIDGDGLIVEKEINTRLSMIVDSGYAMNFKLNGGSTIAVASMPFLSVSGLSLQTKIDTHYDMFSRSINRFKVVRLKLNLSLMDIYVLNFVKLKYFKQFGSYFYLNSVSNTNGRLSTVELMEVKK